MKKVSKMVACTLGAFAFTALFAFNTQAQTSKLTDPQIASIAVTANQIDINYAEIAFKKTKNADVIQFAKTMKDDHTNVIKMCVDLAKKLGVTPETNAVTKSLLEGEAKMKRTLNAAKNGKAFDKAYVDNEVSYHEAVISTVKSKLIPEATNAELKGLLVKVLPALETHLQHAKMLQSKLK